MQEINYYSFGKATIVCKCINVQVEHNTMTFSIFDISRKEATALY
jgi:hypothetical protein